MDKIIAIIAIVLIFGPRLFHPIKDYLLKKEQIKADAMVRAEALRLKNQLELEKLIQNDEMNKVSRQANTEDNVYEERRSSNNKMRY